MMVYLDCVFFCSMIFLKFDEIGVIMFYDVSFGFSLYTYLNMVSGFYDHA